MSSHSLQRTSCVIPTRKTSKHIWLSLFATVAASVLMFASSTWAIVEDDNCDSHLCMFAWWGLIFSSFMAMNSMLACYTNFYAWSALHNNVENEEKESLLGKKNSALPSSPRSYNSKKIPLRIVMLENSVAMFMCLILLYSSMISVIFWSRVNDEDSTIRYLCFTTALILSSLAEFYTLNAKISFLRVTTKDRNKMLLFSANLLLFAMGLTLISMNSSLVDEHNMWMFHGMNAVGILCTISALFGLGITAISHSRASTIFLSSASLPIPYLLLEMFTLGTCVIFCLGNLWLALAVELKPQEYYLRTGFQLNASVGCVVCIVTFMIHNAYDQLLNPHLITPYVAEEVDLKTLSEDELKKWGDDINAAFGTKYIGAWDGHAAVSLMKAYQSVMTGGRDSTIPHTRAVVLRIRDAQTEDIEEGMRDVAYVFVTICEKFDLTNYIPGILGSILGRIFGSDGCIPLLSLRWGIIGFQYPFHSGLFLVKSDDPKFDMTMVQRAVVGWNDSLTRTCHVLQSPCYVTQLDSRAFQDAHFLNLAVGPSVLVDLRRYKGMTYKEFQRVALKKGNRRNHDAFFAKKGGTIVVSREFEDFDTEYPRVVARLAQYTANRRSAVGEVVIPVPVTATLIQSISEVHQHEFRSLFGMSVNGQPAGSAVVFEFPASRLMTSDMSGLRHEIARPTRAYFAMLAVTVEKALKEGFDFVDFGPTTLEPKMDVGGRLVEGRAGYHTRLMIMRSLLKMGNDNFRGQQEEAEKRMLLAGKDESSPFMSHKLPFIESDFQCFDEEMRKKFPNTEKKLVHFNDYKKTVQKTTEKMTKKQRNKERRKAKRKAKKAEHKGTPVPANMPSANPTISPTEDEKM